MNVNTLPYVIPLTIAMLASILTAYFVWRRGGSEAIISIVILLAGAEWGFGYIMEIVIPTLPSKVFWNQMQYLGSTVLITGLLILSLQSVGYDRWITQRNLILVNILPVLSLGFIFTNEWHGLVWPYHVLVARRGILWLEHPHGPVYFVYIWYVYVVIVSASILLLKAIFSGQQRYRRQAIMVLAGILLPFIVNILNFNILYPLNLTQMAFVVAIIPLAWGLLRLQIGDIVPVARTAVFEGMDDCVIVLDGSNRIVDINKAAQLLLDRPAKEVIGQSIATVWPAGHFTGRIGQLVARAWLKPAGRIYQPGDPLDEIGQEVIVGQGADLRIYDMRVSPLVDWRSYVMSQVIVLRNITERVQAEERLHEANEQLRHELAERKRVERQIQESLTEKEVLLKEIHHRVKNNLQVISSMLNLQSGYVDDDATLAIFQDSQNRVRSMALIHEKLYQSDNLALVDFGDYIEHLAAYLIRSYGKDSVQLKIEAEAVQLGIDTAVPCGLILNELISNALKHAFPNSRAGQITISLQIEANNQVCLRVADNGVGLPPELDIFNSPSLGLQLVHALVSQLEGKLQIVQSGGVQFIVSFSFQESVPL